MASGISLRAGPASVPTAAARPRSTGAALARPTEPAPGLPTPDLVEAVGERIGGTALASVGRLLQRED
ncbi:MAG TPA: hypothetical protein VE962_01900 [Actinomycetota bacterium]|nr:hypothetical protein [Actinomycetota bacterium]